MTKSGKSKNKSLYFIISAHTKIGLTATLPYTFRFYHIARIKNGNCFLVPQIMRIFASRTLTKIK